MKADLDTKYAMVKRGYLDKLPILEQGETVTANSEMTSDGMRFVITGDGKKGYIPHLLASKSKEEASNSIGTLIEQAEAESIQEWFAKHKLPPTKLRKAVVHNVLYTIPQIERLKMVGNKNSEMSWAEADGGFKYLVVYYNAKNLNKEEAEALSTNSALRADDGNVYPLNVQASNAATETHKTNSLGYGISNSRYGFYRPFETGYSR
jgi:hypothetical protein